VGGFITFEGIEGSGKSSHAYTLGGRLRDAGHEVVQTREPGGTPLGMALRGLLLGIETPLTSTAELLLYCADRTQHVDQVIRPALAAGAFVVCDRFSDSTIAYQGHGRGLALDYVTQLDRLARGDLRPDLTFLLDCPVEVGLARAKARGPADRFEREAVRFHERVRAGFQALAAADPARVVILDATAPAATVAEAVAAEVARRFGVATP
jgi:dTMP kinase